MRHGHAVSSRRVGHVGALRARRWSRDAGRGMSACSSPEARASSFNFGVSVNAIDAALSCASGHADVQPRLQRAQLSRAAAWRMKTPLRHP